MRKVLISIAAAASALAVATPAAAQFYPQPVRYATPHAYGHARALQGRVDRLQREIGRLAQFRAISPREFQRLRNDARDIERRLRHDIRDGRGLDQREAYALERRIVRLEYRLARDARDGRGWAYRG